jgi:hypothetical protein
VAVSYITSAVLNETNPATGGTITIPTVAAGDDLYLPLTSRGHTAGTPPCTVTDSDGVTWVFEGSDDTVKGQLFWRKAGGATSGKIITIANALTSLCAGIGVYRGGWAAGDPTTDFSTEQNTSPDKAHASFTPTNPDSMICLSVCDQSNAVAVTGVTATTPGTLTIRLEYQNTLASASTVTHASEVQTGGPTATGTINWTMASNQSTKSLVWAIRPQPLAVVTGTAAAGISEVDIVAGGKTLIITLTDDTWVPATP